MKVPLKASLATAFLTLHALPATADTADVICTTYGLVANQAIDYQKIGLTLSEAEKMVNSAFDVDRRLYIYAVQSIRFAYADPAAKQKIQTAIKSGLWKRKCAHYVNTGVIE